MQGRKGKSSGSGEGMAWHFDKEFEGGGNAKG